MLVVSTSITPDNQFNMVVIVRLHRPTSHWNNLLEVHSLYPFGLFLDPSLSSAIAVVSLFSSQLSTSVEPTTGWSDILETHDKCGDMIALACKPWSQLIPSVSTLGNWILAFGWNHMRMKITVWSSVNIATASSAITVPSDVLKRRHPSSFFYRRPREA